MQAIEKLNAGIRCIIGTVIATAALMAAPVALSHFVKDEPLQSYRQSFFALVAMNLSPIASMVKGDAPWDDARMVSFASTLAVIASTDVVKAFPPGSDKGTTRAKPEIWETKSDFEAMYKNFQDATGVLLAAVESEDKAAIGTAVREASRTCKACHDEYTSKAYLY